jgi:hypothetical protein
MEPKDEKLQDRLLSRLPSPSNSAEFRKEVARVLEKNDKVFLRETWAATALWIFCVLLGTAFLWLSGEKYGSAPGAKVAWFGSMACFMLIWAAVEMIKLVINRSRIELLKEIKQVQLQVLELRESVNKS